ncbi:MAG: DUF4149 domain-containing protein [Ramlibacter sp.]
MSHRVAVLAAALWWGSLTALGAVVVPLLFTHLPSPALAGGTAAKLFSAQTWIALGCGLALIVISRGKEPSAQMGWAQGALVFIAAGMLLALLGEFAVAPRIVARDNLRLWHAVGSGMFVLQWLCAGVALWKLAGLQDVPDAPLRSDAPS